MIYFTSDLHFGHANIVRFDNRPFKDVEEMDRALIDNWNRKVKDEDTVYILGDISWYDKEKTKEIFQQLYGKKILIRGNHDRRNIIPTECFAEIRDYKELKLSGNRNVVLCHYPIVFFNRHHYGAYMLYGHVHNSHEWNMTESHKRELQQLDIQCNMFNVGCMVRNYEPVTLDEILKQEERKEHDGNQYQRRR